MEVKQLLACGASLLTPRSTQAVAEGCTSQGGLGSGGPFGKAEEQNWQRQTGRLWNGLGDAARPDG